MSGVVIVRTGGEIGIKSKPVRSGYERLILKSIKTRLKEASLPFSKTWRIAGRIYIECEETEAVATSLSRIFGVSSTSAGISMGSDLATIVDQGTQLARRSLKPGSFAIRCRRVGRHDYGSQDVSRALGEAALSTGIPLKVDLERPEQVLYVEIRDSMAVLYAGQNRGPDGFPLGAQNPVIGVMDGSPEALLASWCIMKRGSDLKAVVPASGEKGSPLDKPVERDLRLLAAWKPNGRIRATAVPLPQNLPPKDKEVYLLAAACRVASRRGVEAVVSGLSPSLEAMKKLMGLPVFVLFPMMASDEALASAWASMVGSERKGPSGRMADVGALPPSTELERCLESSEELVVKS